MLNDSNSIDGVRHLWGVPIPPDREFDEDGNVWRVPEVLQYSVTSFWKGLFFKCGEFTRIDALPSWSWVGWDSVVSYDEEFVKRNSHEPSEVCVSIELKNGPIFDKIGPISDWDTFHKHYTELNNDYSQLTHFIRISAPVALAHVEKDRTPEGKIRCIFHLEKGRYLRTQLQDVDCTGTLHYNMVSSGRLAGSVYSLS